MTEQERRARQTRRDPCRACGRPTLHPFAGWATGDGWENTIRPRAYYRTCTACGLLVLVLADVNDAEGLCRAVVDEHLREHTGGAGGRDAKQRARVTATGAPITFGTVDYELGLYELTAVCWRQYSEKWNPARGVAFAGYVLPILRKRLLSWIRDETGDASGRSKGRVHPKAHAPSVSTSLDALQDDGGPDRPDRPDSSVGIGPDDLGPVEAAFARRAGDLADDRSPDLSWALAARSR